MNLPFSGSKFDQLGKRLASREATEADILLFEQARLAYSHALEEIQDVLVALGFNPTGRIKTTPTLVDKLRRTPGLTIRGVNDLAGARVVVSELHVEEGSSVGGLDLDRDVTLRAGRFAQDVAVQLIMKSLARLSQKESKLIDRREEDNNGYRAVHIVAYVDRLPVEIQVRTPLQHQWAEVNERLADMWGRGLRYGDGPESPQEPAWVGARVTRQEMVDVLAEVSGEIARYELVCHQLDRLDLRLALADQIDAIEQLRTEVEALKPDLATREEAYRAILTRFEELLSRLEP